MGTFLQDLRYAIRTLFNSPGFMVVAVLTLALGIGANTAIFTLIDAVMLRLLPVERPEELVQVRRQDPKPGSRKDPNFTNPLWEQVRDRQDVFAGVFAWSGEQLDLSRGGAVQNVAGIIVSGSYFPALGVRPAAGRLLSPADDQRGCPAVVALSYGFWQDHLGGALAAIGSTLSLNRHPFQVIGVSAPRFFGVEVGEKFDVAIPICAAALFDGKLRSRLDQRNWWWLNVMGRIKPGISPTALNARLGVLSPQIFGSVVPEKLTPKYEQEFASQLLVTVPAANGTPYARNRFGDLLTVLMSVVGLVLLIACANLASLMLARANSRGREIALRKALGASRWRLIRQLLTEAVLLSGAGALLGLLFARWGSALLVHYVSTRKTPVFLDLSLDSGVLAFAAATAVLTGLLFGVLPALRSTRVSLTAAMKGSKTTEGADRQHFRTGRWVVAAQVALSLVVLAAAGLLLRSFVKLITLETGFDSSNVLIVKANLVAAEVPPEQWLPTYDALEDRLRALPGVVSAGRAVVIPTSGASLGDTLYSDAPGGSARIEAPAHINFISPGFFPTLRMSLLAGRNFDEHDTKTSPQVAILNETLGKKLFPGTNPVGKTFRPWGAPGDPVALVEVVGIAKDSTYGSLREDTVPTAFLPATQITFGDGAQSFFLRTAIRPTALMSSVQEAAAAVNKDIPLEFHTLAEQVDDSLVEERLLAMLSAFFGSLALLLASIGLYGALSYLVTQQQAEFGIRLALGAPPHSILRLVLRDVLLILVGGVAAGICISLATVTLLRNVLFGLAPRDPTTMAGVTLLLAVVALIACYIPARRATRVDPMEALRYE